LDSLLFLQQQSAVERRGNMPPPHMAIQRKERKSSFPQGYKNLNKACQGGIQIKTVTLNPYKNSHFYIMYSKHSNKKF
jgi:hypothetical protein